ncbi:unnamed protein product [Haemonchus placei]|uniref:RING-type domain-containing protein n=1 Tax=Haemonchus placei TaxID=6290 RepID=A0A0N4W9U0_HAEPC|nr:unnamed protein product [Haemonchus placei]
MSNLVHCMVCFTFPVPDLKFYLSSCGHIVCFKCVQKGALALKCKVCQKDNPQVVEINSNMKPESNSVEMLQRACKEEMRKKNQYKADLQRISVEYKKKCKETIALKDQIVKMNSCALNLNDLTSDPFRTPTMEKGLPRSFTTSTPYKQPRQRDEDSTESPMMLTNQSGSSTSFASVGIPLTSMDSGGEISKLAHMTSAMCRNSTISDTLQTDRNSEEGSSSSLFPGSRTLFPFTEGHGQSGDTSTSNDSNSAKTPATKKSKLDIMSRTQPLPMKYARPEFH